MKKLFGFLKNKSGATAIEYALIAGLIGVTIVAGAGTLGTSINGGLSTVGDKVDTAVGN